MEAAIREHGAAMSSPPDLGPAYEPQVMPPLTMPAVICHELHLVEDNAFFLHIKVVAESATAKAWPFPMRADLGRRIADMIKADIAADAAGAAT